MIYWFILFVVVFSAAVLFYLYVSGLFQKVYIRCDIPRFGTVCFAYKFYKGSYSDVGVYFKEIKKLSSNTKTNMMGIYYDDPEKVEKGKQRFALGVILNDSELNIDSNVQKIFVDSSYKICWLTKIDNAVLAEFPCTTALSPLLAIFFVYPKLKEFIRKKKTLCVSLDRIL